MQKFQIYRTALDALQFLLTAELSFGDKTLDFLDSLFQFVSDELKDEMHNAVSKKTAKEL